MNQFINHAAMISQKRGKYPRIIANTDSSEKSGTYWWRILYTEPKTIIFFLYSFRRDGLKHFIIQDERKVIEKILLRSGQMSWTDNKITLLILGLM